MADFYPEQADSWRRKAACHNHPCPDLWFPDKGGAITTARRICQGCPVRRKCGQEAIDTGEQWAIAAGFSCRTIKGQNELRAWLGVELLPVKHECGCGEPVERAGARCLSCRGLAPTEPVLAHLEELRNAGKSVPEIAVQSQVPMASLRHLLWGDSEGRVRRHMSREAAERICAIRVEVRS